MNTIKVAIFTSLIMTFIAACGGSSAAKVCTYGQDQTCNDSMEVSALWGACQADGTCVCKPYFMVNPATGRCMPGAAPDGGSADGGTGDGGAGDAGISDAGPADGGIQSCGKYTCLGDEFCVERIHDHDAGAAYSSWECMMYWNECPERNCACAIKSFISASCMNPVCTSYAPVRLKCDDLN